MDTLSQAAAPDAPTLLSLLPRLTFTQGLVVGQLSIICVVVALVRYLLFEDHAAAREDEAASKDGEDDSEARRRTFPTTSSPQPRRPALAGRASSLLSLSLSSLPTRAKSPPIPPLQGGGEKAGSGPSLPTLARIPDAVGYDMETGADCDVGWLNVLVAHVWEGYRDDFLAGGSQSTPQEGEEGGGARRTARDFMQDVLNRRRPTNASSPSFLDPINVTAVHPGSSYPLLSNARVRPRDDAGRVRIEVDVDYSDVLSLDITTALCLNFPRPRFAVLPLSLGLRVTRFSGTLSLSIVSHPSAKPDERSRHSLEVSLHPDFLLLATCSSLVGSRAKLQDIPKIQQVMLQRIRGAILDKVGWPKVWTVQMPDLVTGRRGEEPEQHEDGVQGQDEDEVLYEEDEVGYEDEEALYYDEETYGDEQDRAYASGSALPRRRAYLNGHPPEEHEADITPRPRRRFVNGAAATGQSLPRGPTPTPSSRQRPRRPPQAPHQPPPLPTDQMTSISRRPPPARPQVPRMSTANSRGGRRTDGVRRDAGQPPPPLSPQPPMQGVEAWRKEMVRKTRGGTPGAERTMGRG
ncbi:hypothetical protein BDZ90DRAFT_234515 [Jaminaea rosea]|uniref:Maintenance of mitochondrial morphology protein 1 n=1 Tax=Jaminaea rosea TaxID=1569628 RepID=A0A316ULU6_9BASI|nr:hypothetical protein BDZ90DRAFT_234515 [Jaminaea rosea]PWN24903.1 hypothetical protein BDZ90DRAFT_234515 [Jaminaea rosea]